MKKVFINEKQVKKLKSPNLHLDSFNVKKKLVDKFWVEEKLNKDVKETIKAIVDSFMEFANIETSKIKKIILIGSICNYNWSKFSDVDVHIVIDYSKIDKRKDFVQEYFDSKKQLWNDEHQKLKIFGHKVEIYVQDINDEVSSDGEYDVTHDKWVSKPEKDDSIDELVYSNKDKIKKKSLEIIKQISNVEKTVKKETSKSKLKVQQNKVDELLNKLKELRKKGLSSKDGEYSVGNLVYKCVRRTGYFDKLWDLSVLIFDKMNSINENKNILEVIKRGDLFMLVNEEVNADGNSDHNPYAKLWKQEREILKNFIIINGVLMTSMENGKLYKVYWDKGLSALIGVNYAVCLQYDPLTMENGSTVYIRALSKFTKQIFQPEFDTRGKDNVSGTSDDVI